MALLTPHDKNLVWATAANFMAPAMSVRPPRVRRTLSLHSPAASTLWDSESLWDFGLFGSFIYPELPLCGFCSSGQRFACTFLQIPPHGVAFGVRL